ncbi:MAG: hypothetical protein IH598_09815 [Bacteroidales bacterium]|nr:hypothetical protein [Bacteroidales bacterium]
MHCRFRFFIFLFFSLSFLFSCKKEAEEIFPEVQFIGPASNASYDVFDTIPITIRVNWNQSEIALKINLQDESSTPVVPSLVLENFKTGVETTLYYVISNETLSTGNYRLMAEAREGEIYTRAYRTVYVHEIERQLTHIFVVQHEAQTVQRIHRFNPAMGDQLTTVFDGDYAGSDVSSSSKQFFIAGIHWGDLTAFDTETMTINWASPIIPNPVQPYFTCLKAMGNQVFAGLWDGYTGRWSMTGQKGVSTQITPDTYSYLLFSTDKYLVTAALQKSSYLVHWIEVFYLDAGGLVNATHSDIIPVIFTDPEPGNILILGNNQRGNAYVRRFDPANGMLNFPYQPFDMPAKPIIAAEAISPGRILLAFDSGVYMYDYQKSFTSFISVPDVRIIRYEDISRTIWMIAAGKVLVYDLNGALVSEFNIGGELVNLHLMYNK